VHVKGTVQCSDLCSLKEFTPYRCVVSFARFRGRLMMRMASNGHFCGLFKQKCETIT